MTTLDTIRTQSEADFIAKLKKLNERHRLKLLAARRKYGSVKAIPDSVWREIASETESETTALLLLILIAGYTFTLDSLSGLRRPMDDPLDVGKRFAERRGREFGDGYAETTRKRWEDLEDAIDDLGKDQTPKARLEATEKGLGEILNAGRAETAGITETTGGLSAGQRAAGDDIRVLNPGVDVALFWRTERDDRVCPVCAPLDGKSEAYCDSIGIGQPAHPRCRCEWVAKIAGGVREAVEPKDGDGDGLIDDGKPTERPAPVKRKAFQDWAEPGDVNITATASPDFGGKHDLSSEFTAGGRKFYAEANLVDASQFRGKLPDAKGIPVFGFVDEDGEYKVTGKGNAMSTMRQASATAIAMLKTSDADIMVFQDGEGGSRGKLYRNFTRRAASLVDGYRGVYIGKDANGIMTFGVAKQSYIDGPLKSNIADGIVELAESQAITDADFWDDEAFWDEVFKGLGSTQQP